MTKRELIYITTIAKMGTISKAAEVLFVAQPSLSRGLQKIESDLGVELFKRAPDGLRPTMAGEYYIESANAILKTYKEMEIKLSHLGEMKTGRVTIGTTTFLGSFALPFILKTFHQLYPNIDISVYEDVSKGVEEAILNGAVDVGILHAPLVTENIGHTVVARERFLLALPPDDPAAGQSYRREDGERYLDIRVTQNRDFILTHPTQRTRQVSEAILARAGIEPRIRYLTKSIQTASRMVNAGLGVTLVPHSYCSLFAGDFSPAYYFLEERWQPHWELIMCYSKDIPLSRAADEIIRIGRETLPSIYRVSAR